MNKKIALLCLALVGCDPLYGPTIQNGFGTDVEVAITYSTGETNSTVWPRCFTASVGKLNRSVSKISIKSGGKMIRELTPEEVREIAKNAGRVSDSSVWKVSESGVELIDGSRAKACGTSAEER